MILSSSFKKRFPEFFYFAKSIQINYESYKIHINTTHLINHSFSSLHSVFLHTLLQNRASLLHFLQVLHFLLHLNALAYWPPVPLLPTRTCLVLLSHCVQLFLQILNPVVQRITFVRKFLVHKAQLSEFCHFLLELFCQVVWVLYWLFVVRRVELEDWRQFFPNGRQLRFVVL